VKMSERRDKRIIARRYKCRQPTDAEKAASYKLEFSRNRGPLTPQSRQG
jgi:hypothetical protein